MKIIYSVLSAFFLFTACSNTPVKNDPVTTPVKDTLKKDSLAIQKPAEKKVLEPVNRSYNDIARFIAGMQHVDGSPYTELEKNPQWVKHAQHFSESWAKLDSTKLAKYRSWTKEELAPVHTSTSTLFYPFAGADVMHVYNLFPNAKQYIMIGLEPSGTIPNINAEAKDSLKNYFGMVNKALDNILNFSFFRTKSMAVDFHSKELDGTLPIMMVFLARTGNTIIDLKAAHYNEKGEIGYDKITDLKKSNGVEISFVNEKTPTFLQKVYYFTVNLGDGTLSKNIAFKNMVEKRDSVTTYLKSASYLMHKAYFSTIRGLILNKSKYVLQDDSGIAFRFFEKKDWDIQLYGTYDKPIPLFANMFQQDYKDAYSAGSIKPISFGIGYDYKEGESNLLLAKKK